MKWVYLNDSPFFPLSDYCVYWGVQLISAYKFVAKFYIYLPHKYEWLIDFKIVHGDCTLLGNDALMTQIGQKFIPYGQRPFGYEDGDWWFVEYPFSLTKDIPATIESCNKDSNTDCSQNHMELKYQLSRELFECRINFLPLDVKIVFEKNVLLCQSMKTSIIGCIRKLLSSQQNTYYDYNFDWLEILLKYIPFDDNYNGYCDYNDRYKNVVIECNNKNNNTKNLRDRSSKVPTRIRKRRRRVKNSNVNKGWDSQSEYNNDLDDSTLIHNSKYSKNCYQSSKIRQKINEKKAQNRQYKKKKMEKNKCKHYFNKKIARTEKYQQYASVIEEGTEHFYDVFHFECCGCCLCGLSCRQCSCWYCRQWRSEQQLLKDLADREWMIWWEMEVENQQNQREQEWLFYIAMEDAYIFENITDAALNIYFNKKYKHNCFQSLTITKNIAKKRKNNEKIKMKKMEKMKKKKYFMKDNKKSKYKNKYPKKMNHFDF